MVVYARQTANALRTLKAKGENCVWASFTEPTPNTEQPWLQTPGIAIDYPDTAIAFFPLTRLGSESVVYLNGMEVIAGSDYGLMGAVGFTPKLTDTVLRNDGTRLTPISIERLAPNGEVILYTIKFAQ